MPHKNERVELEIKIIKYRALARQASDAVTTQRVEALSSELEKKLREIVELDISLLHQADVSVGLAKNFQIAHPSR